MFHDAKLGICVFCLLSPDSLTGDLQVDYPMIPGACALSSCMCVAVYMSIHALRKFWDNLPIQHFDGVLFESDFLIYSLIYLLCSPEWL